MNNWDIIKLWICDKLNLCDHYKTRIAECENKLEAYEEQIQILKNSLNKKTEICNALQKQLDECRQQSNNEDEDVCPDWLDQNQRPYTPKINIVWNGKVVSTLNVPTHEFYTTSPYLEGRVKQLQLDGLPLNQKFMKIWDFVTRAFHYDYDHGEDWRFPQVTNLLGVGDCEDTTILFVTLCKIAGISAGRVFNATGLWRGTGHSFPIVKMEDDKWYVMESTLNRPTVPVLFKTSEYDASWGVSNWKFSGKLKPDHPKVDNFRV